MTELKLADGKYTIIYDDSENRYQFAALRYGEPWRDLVGDGLVLSMVHRIKELEQERDDLKEALSLYYPDGEASDRREQDEALVDRLVRENSSTETTPMEQQWIPAEEEEIFEGLRFIEVWFATEDGIYIGTGNGKFFTDYETGTTISEHEVTHVMEVKYPAPPSEQDKGDGGE